MNYQYILFDLDGTLTNPTEGILNSIKYGLKKLDISIPDDAVLQTFIGPPLKDSFMQHLNLDEQTADEAIHYYREYFSKNGIYENYVYDGIVELLEELVKSGRTLLLATSKPEKFAKEILIHFNLEKYFTGINGATMDGSRSKKSDVIHHALEQEKITDPLSCLMIGDTKFDIYGAHENGVASVGVLWGIGNMQELEHAQATFIIEKPTELKDILQGNADYVAI